MRSKSCCWAAVTSWRTRKHYQPSIAPRVSLSIPLYKIRWMVDSSMFKPNCYHMGRTASVVANRLSIPKGFSAEYRHRQAGHGRRSRKQSVGIRSKTTSPNETRRIRVRKMIRKDKTWCKFEISICSLYYLPFTSESLVAVVRFCGQSWV